MPIRSESLNLRQHIETAGHQIELCLHVSIDATSCRGYLHKMGSKFHHWNKRWFVFDRMRRTLTYYSDRGEKKPRGGAYFQVYPIMNPLLHAFEALPILHSSKNNVKTQKTYIFSRRKYLICIPGNQENYHYNQLQLYLNCDYNRQ